MTLNSGGGLTRVLSASRTLPFCSCVDIACRDPCRTWGQCLMIATVFSRGRPIGGRRLDARATPRVVIPLFGALVVHRRRRRCIVCGSAWEEFGLDRTTM